MSNKNALQGANVRTSCISLRTPATNKHSQHTEKPALSLRYGMRRSLRRTFFRPELKRCLSRNSPQSLSAKCSFEIALCCLFGMKRERCPHFLFVFQLLVFGYTKNISKEKKIWIVDVNFSI